MAFTYNPKNVRVILTKGNRTVKVTGFAEDSFIEIAPKGEGTQSQTGCDGTVVRSIDVNKQVTVRLTLQQTSPYNSVFKSYFNSDKESGDGTFALTITEGNGKPLLATGEDGAWVQNHATITRGKNAGNTEWTLETDSVDF